MSSPNTRRAERASTAISKGKYDVKVDLDSAISDLLTDLRHLADHSDIDFDSLLARAETNYATECREDDVQ